MYEVSWKPGCTGLSLKQQRDLETILGDRSVERALLLLMILQQARHRGAHHSRQLERNDGAHRGRERVHGRAEQRPNMTPAARQSALAEPGMGRNEMIAFTTAKENASIVCTQAVRPPTKPAMPPRGRSDAAFCCEP